MVVSGDGYILAGGGWWLVVLDIFWLVVSGGGWWLVVMGGCVWLWVVWMVVAGGGWCHSLV